MKAKDVATLIAPKASESSQVPQRVTRMDTTNNDEYLNGSLPDALCRPAVAPQSPCWYPLSWRSGFPRSFSLTELQDITNSFSKENHVLDQDDSQLYQGILQETHVLVQRFPGNDHALFWSVLKILSRVRHRHVMNLVGYCCTGSSMFLLFDYPCIGSLEMNLRRIHKNYSCYLNLVFLCSLYFLELKNRVPCFPSF